MPRANFGRRLREIRTERKLTQRQLAAQLFISANQVQNYEKGKNMPPMHRLLLIARALYCEIPDLFMPAGSRMPKYRVKNQDKKGLILELFQRPGSAESDDFREFEEFDDVDTPLPRFNARNP